MVNMLNDWLERPIVMRGPGQTLMTSPRHEPHLSLSRVSASRAQSRAECHPAHIATSRHAQTQTQEIQEKHPQPSGLCPGAGRRCEDPRILRNQEARAEREKKER